MLSEATSDAITLSDLYLSRYPYCQGASANTLKGVAFKALRLPMLPHRRKFSSPEDPDAAARYRADLVSALEHRSS